MIHFCEVCGNMYYITISETDSNKLNFYCRNCGNKDSSLTEKGLCVLDTNLKKGKKTVFNHLVNKYTKLDNTLPRIYNIKCPNKECRTNHEFEETKGDDESQKESNIIYMRYEDDSMLYLYICVICDTKWKTDDNI